MEEDISVQLYNCFADFFEHRRISREEQLACVHGIYMALLEASNHSIKEIEDLFLRSLSTMKEARGSTDETS